MFLTSFKIYFVFGYECFLCVCLKTATRLFWDKVWLFWWRQVGNPAAQLRSSWFVFLSQETCVHCKRGFHGYHLAFT